MVEAIGIQDYLAIEVGVVDGGVGAVEALCLFFPVLEVLRINFHELNDVYCYVLQLARARHALQGG